MNDYFCVLPFYGFELDRRGKNIYCCKLQTGANINAVRESMLAQQRSEACSACWKLEDQGIQSERQLQNSTFDFYLDRDLDKIEQDVRNHQYSTKIVKLWTSNICNGTCVTCGSQASSAWAALEGKPINYKTIEPDLINNISWQDITQLSLVGGEPLLEKQNFNILNRLIETNNTDCLVSIVTNGSCDITDRQFQTLQQFRNLSICLSIDGIGPVFEYMRFPLKWSVMLENMAKFKTIAKHLSASYTISNVNILYYQETVDWFASQNLQFHHNLVTWPTYYNVNSLPKSAKSDPAIAKFFREHVPLDDMLFAKAIAELTRQDQLKKINCRDFVPKFTALF
jgi:hypothetical protein